MDRDVGRRFLQLLIGGPPCPSSSRSPLWLPIARRTEFRNLAFEALIYLLLVADS